MLEAGVQPRPVGDAALPRAVILETKSDVIFNEKDSQLFVRSLPVRTYILTLHRSCRDTRLTLSPLSQ